MIESGVHLNWLPTIVFKQKTKAFFPNLWPNSALDVSFCGIDGTSIGDLPGPKGKNQVMFDVTDASMVWVGDYQKLVANYVYKQSGKSIVVKLLSLPKSSALSSMATNIKFIIASFIQENISNC